MSDLVVVVGNPRPDSRTLDAAVRVADVLGTDITTDEPLVLDLAKHVAVAFTDEPAWPAQPAPDAVEQLTEARVLVVATPSYKGTFTGLLKVFLDQLPHEGLSGVVAVPVAVAGSPAHVEATGAALATLLRELGAQVTEPVGLLDSVIAETGAVEQAARAVLPGLTALVPAS